MKKIIITYFNTDMYETHFEGNVITHCILFVGSDRWPKEIDFNMLPQYVQDQIIMDFVDYED